MTYFTKNQIDLMIEADRRDGYLERTILPATTLTKDGSLPKEGSPLDPALVAALKRDASDQVLYSMVSNTLGYVLSDRVQKREALSACKEFLCKRGLITWIKESDEFFLQFLRTGEIPEHQLFKPLLSLVLSTEYDDMLSIQVAGEIFRFAKRFAPQANTKLAAKCAQEFWQRETQNRAKDRNEISWWMVSKIRNDCKHLFQSMKQFEFDVSRIVVSPNAIQAICNCSLCKTVALECIKGISNPYISPDLAEKVVTALHDDYAREFWKTFTMYQCLNDTDKTCKIVGWNYVVGNPVPKNWKSYRMIAPETAEEYSDQWQVVEWLREWLESTDLLPGDPLINHVPLYDQSSQRLRAQEGSVSGLIATMDLSNASDCHRKAAIRSILPSWVAIVICQFLPKGIRIGKRAEWLSMVAPMGSPLTFVVMQICIFCILYSCTLTHARFCNWDTERRLLALQRIGVVGDDITVDSEVFEDAVDWLSRYGFEVNLDKSFNTQGSHCFREACGGDYLNGVDITAHYWPRRPITLSKGSLTYWHVDGYTGKLDDDLSLLIEMSKNIRAFSPSAAVYLNDICRKIEPSLTESPVGSTNPDLWSEFPLAKGTSEVPYAKVHRTLCWDEHSWEPAEEVRDGIISWVRPARIPRKNPLKPLGAEDAFVTRRKTRDLTIDEYVTLRAFLNAAEWDRGMYHEVFEKIPLGTPGSSVSLGFELTCTPKMVSTSKAPRSNSKCIVERVLTRAHISFAELARYETYQLYLEKGPQFENPLDELLHISKQRKPEDIFGNTQLTWTLK